jgi:hypothetical protein
MVKFLRFINLLSELLSLRLILHSAGPCCAFMALIRDLKEIILSPSCIT